MNTAKLEPSWSVCVRNEENTLAMSKLRHHVANKLPKVHEL